MDYIFQFLDCKVLLWASKAGKIMNMHTNESNVHKQCEFAQMYYQALAKKSSTTHKNVEPHERNMKPQKQLQLSHKLKCAHKQVELVCRGCSESAC